MILLHVWKIANVHQAAVNAVVLTYSVEMLDGLKQMCDWEKY